MNEVTKAVKAYRKQFGEGPPILRMSDNDTIALIEKAIKTNKKIIDADDQNVPSGSYN